MATSLKDTVAFITGGSNGVGAAVVSLFLDQGARVASVDVVPQTEPESSRRINIKCDISSEAEVQKAFDRVIQTFGELQVLVNCAGVMDGFERVGTVTNEMWDRVLSINLNGPMYTMRHALPYLLKSQGNIVNICSVGSISGGCAGVSYTVSKHALLGLTRSTAYLYAKEGLRCNAVLPGGVETEIMKNSKIDPKKMDQEGLANAQPYLKVMPGTCKAADVARVVHMLATSPAVNGAEVTVDRGWSAA